MANAPFPTTIEFQAGQEIFLRSGTHCTMHFCRVNATAEGVYVETKFTMDPNEDMDCETLTWDEALAKYNEALTRVGGFTYANGWHKDKRCEHWYDDGHDD